MKHFISHRGNLIGPNKSEENKPEFIDLALNEGYEVEIDIRMIDGVLYLGHDTPDYKIELDWLFNRKEKLWIHCKNYEALNYFTNIKFDFNYFWHNNDSFTLTSKKIIWAFPSKIDYENVIIVLPELKNNNLGKALGACSDYIKLFKDDFTNLRD